jgi:hypothetical protein
MDDPHIQAFTIISDRVSALEEMVTAMYERKKRKELTSTGPLDYRFLRFPFSIERWPADTRDVDPQTESPIREAGAASDVVQSAVVTFEEFENWGHHADHCADPAVFNAEECCRSDALEVHREDGLRLCIECKDARSHLRYVCLEGVARRLKNVVATGYSDVVKDARLVADDDGCYLALTIMCCVDLPVDRLLRLVMVLVTKAGGNQKAINHVGLHTCHQSVVWYWRFLDEPHTLKDYQRRHLKQHPYFGSLMK